MNPKGVAVDAYGGKYSLPNDKSTFEDFINYIVGHGDDSVGKVSGRADKAEISIGKKDLDALRKKWNVPETNTVAVGKTDIPELKNFTFEGGSPEVRKEAGLPTLDEIFPNSLYIFLAALQVFYPYKYYLQ